MKSGLFVSASDTGAGKTIVSKSLIANLRLKGMDAVGYKPVESGCDKNSVPEDGVALWEASDRCEPLDRICPVKLEAALAPNIAARLQGVQLSEEELIRGFTYLSNRHDAVIVESAGGACSPVTDKWLVRDLAAAMGLPVLLVVPDKLGAINQALSALSCMNEKRVNVEILALNRTARLDDGSSQGNVEELKRLVPHVSVAGPLPWFSHGSPISESRFQDSVSALAELVIGLLEAE